MRRANSSYILIKPVSSSVHKAISTWGKLQIERVDNLHLKLEVIQID